MRSARGHPSEARGRDEEEPDNLNEPRNPPMSRDADEDPGAAEIEERRQ